MKKKVFSSEKICLRNVKGRSASSQRWLQRQLSDPYVHWTKVQGYRSRAAFKLEQMDDKWKFLKLGKSVVDLGAAPGGWTQVAVSRVNPQHKPGVVVGVDLLFVKPIPGATLFQGDFYDFQVVQAVQELVSGPVQVVMSDMAASSCGQSQIDHLRIMDLAELAFEWAEKVLTVGGVYLAKTLRGGTERLLLERLKKSFERVVHEKPPASRTDSSEMYVLGLGFRR